MARLLLTEVADAGTDDIIADLGLKGGPAIAIKYEQQFHTLYRRSIDHPASGPVARRSAETFVSASFLLIWWFIVTSNLSIR
jgi:plasmid stabilization system protein ParE